MEGQDHQSSISLGSSGDASRLGFLARLDRLLRRWLPGYSLIRGRRSSPSEISISGGSTFGSRAAHGRRGRRGNKQEVYLDTGIAKSEFCDQLENLLRNKLLQKQQEQQLALQQQERGRGKERELSQPLHPQTVTSS
ncbi:uncharacterized protein LOC108105440 [Drosophila eugracilis]|uniref:uncharacterized protein LOC108105440 n=1 Tax=Drosophila eugracilis TaxID=29029 RepID=UPI0007E70173|nr:uncharacterized protein LOC108105440 [Drosophila eugracilis]